jgi:hypothetical protein
MAVSYGSRFVTLCGMGWTRSMLNAASCHALKTLRGETFSGCLRLGLVLR